jgi:hypothetical protein
MVMWALIMLGLVGLLSCLGASLLLYGATKMDIEDDFDAREQ